MRFPRRPWLVIWAAIALTFSAGASAWATSSPPFRSVSLTIAGGCEGGTRTPRVAAVHLPRKALKVELVWKNLIYIMTVGLGFYLGGAIFTVLVLMAVCEQAHVNAEIRQAAYDGAPKACPIPVSLDQTLGPEHPGPAKNPHTRGYHLAIGRRFTGADKFYKRASVISR